MRTRNWSIRAKVISLLLVPLTTLIVMWGLATAVTLGPGLDVLDAQSDQDNIARPGKALVAQLQAERKTTAVYQTSTTKDDDGLLTQRARTDEAARDFRQLSGGQDALDAATETTRQQLTVLLDELDRLGELRGAVDRGTTTRTEALNSYTRLISSGYLLFGSLVRSTDENVARDSAALVDLAHSREAFSLEDAVLSAALAGETMTAGDINQTIQLIGAQRYLYAQTIPTLPELDRADYDALAISTDFATLRALEDTVMARSRDGEPAPITATAWQRAHDNVAAELEQLELRGADRLADRSLPAAATIFGRIAIAGLLGLIAVIITIIATARIGGSLIKRLAGLRQAALELAVDRLPRVVARLRQGEPVDIANEAPALPYGLDEIGQVGHAFNELQRTAVNSAIDEANVRRGLNEVFLNIAGEARRCCTANCPSWTGWSAAPTTRPSSRTCSGSTTWRPGCAATRRTSSSSPGPLPGVVGATPCRSWTFCGARCQRWRTMPA